MECLQLEHAFQGMTGTVDNDLSHIISFYILHISNAPTVLFNSTSDASKRRYRICPTYIVTLQMPRPFKQSLCQEKLGQGLDELGSHVQPETWVQG